MAAFLYLARQLGCTLKTAAPPWTREDSLKLAGEQLTSHALVRDVKPYVKAAWLSNVHLH